VGLFDFNLVATLIGENSILARTVYVLVGLSALWQLAPLFAVFGSDEPSSARTFGSLKAGPVAFTQRDHPATRCC
jgi:uncharacterized membrane protein YuzA (DUF378 family)